MVLPVCPRLRRGSFAQNFALAPERVLLPVKSSGKSTFPRDGRQSLPQSPRRSAQPRPPPEKRKSLLAASFPIPHHRARCPPTGFPIVKRLDPRLPKGKRLKVRSRGGPN